MVTRASRLAARKPSPTYMIGSIMKYASGPECQPDGPSCHVNAISSSLPGGKPDPANWRLMPIRNDRVGFEGSRHRCEQALRVARRGRVSKSPEGSRVALKF